MMLNAAIYLPHAGGSHTLPAQNLVEERPELDVELCWNTRCSKVPRKMNIAPRDSRG